MTRFVSVPNPEPGLGDVVGDEQVDALAAELVGGPVERAGLGREPDEDGRASGSRVARRRCRAAAIRATSARRSGGRLELERQAVVAGELRRRRRGAGRKSATAAAMTRASKPAEPIGARGRRAQRGVEVGRGLDPDDVAPAGSGTSTFAGDEVTRAPRSSAASAIGDAHLAGRAVADEADRVDRLARCRRR